MHKPYSVKQEKKMIKWIKGGKPSAEISRKMKARFANLDPTRTTGHYMTKIYRLKKLHAPEKIKEFHRVTANLESLYRKGLNRVNNTKKELGPRAYASLTPEEKARVVRKRMIAWIDALKRRDAKPVRAVIRPPWDIPGMTRKKEKSAPMKIWRGVNRHNGVPFIKNAVGRISREPGFYVVRYDPYDLIKVGMSKDVRQRLRGYMASSDGKARLLHLRRFEKNNDIKGERFASRAARYEASFLYQLSEKGVKPAYGDEWFRQGNYKKIREVLSMMNTWDRKTWNLSTMINKNGHGIQKFGKLVGQQTGTNWNLEQSNSEE